MSEGWRIPAGNDAVIREMLTVAPGGSWRLRSWRVRARWIDASYLHRRGGWVILRLIHPSRRPTNPVPTRHSERFIVALVEARGLDRDTALSVFDVVLAGLRRGEHAFVWEGSDEGTFDLEALAFARGLKPARRICSGADDAMATAHAALRAGYSVCVLSQLEVYPDRPTLTFVARDAGTAAALAESELQQFVEDRARAAQGIRDCGRLLGYPRCCVEAFMDSVAREPTVVADGLPSARAGALGNWVRFDAAWVPRADPLLNTLLLGEHLGLLSFDPCRFDCPAARAIAEPFAAVVAAELPRLWQDMRTALARPVAMDCLDRRAWVELEERADGSTWIRSATPIRAIHGQPADPGLAALLPGHPVDGEGRVPDLDLDLRVLRHAMPA
ncbi:MAG: hypothetical protein KC431_05645 [Myxococcales bacterium]|nr:hypothetical protein [Myxococcales bacterium]